MKLFDQPNVYADLATCHRGSIEDAAKLIVDIMLAGAIPKVQLYSNQTWPLAWCFTPNLLPTRFVPSVFRPSDVDFIIDFKPLALKIASVESTHWDLLDRCLQESVPLIVSTGGMDEDEILKLIEQVGEHQPGVCLMHCVSIYPTPFSAINLGRLAALGELIDQWAPEIELGWSSHYPVINAAAVGMAYAMGATQFEFHVMPWGRERYVSLDEQCAVLPVHIRDAVNILQECEKFYGSDQLTGPDREQVMEWRKRWQD